MSRDAGINAFTALPWVAAAFLSVSLFSHTVALRLLLLGLGVGLAAVAVWRNRDEIQILPAIWLPFAVWAAWAVLSLTWSIEPARTLKELRNEVLYTGVALWVCFIGAQASNAARVLLPVVAAAATAVIGVALWNFARGWDHYYQVGLHGGPGDHSSALLTLAPCLAMASWYARRAGWPLALQALAPLLGVLFLMSAYATLNRTIWLGLAVEFLVLGAFLLVRGRSVRTARALIAVLALAVVSTTAFALFSVQAEREATGAKSIPRDNRLALWPEIVDKAEERPLTGYGFGRGLLRLELREEFGRLDGQLWHAHNLFLDALIQLGAPGLALLVVLLGMLLREAWRHARNADERVAACGIALFAVVAGMLVRNMTDTLLVRQNALLFWGIVGVLLGLGRKSWRA